jgi:hypothetical protein
MDETISVSYKAAIKKGHVGRVYEIWVKRVPHLDPITRGKISSLWQDNSVELVVSKDELNNGT